VPFVSEPAVAKKKGVECKKVAKEKKSGSVKKKKRRKRKKESVSFGWMVL